MDGASGIGTKLSNMLGERIATLTREIGAAKRALESAEGSVKALELQPQEIQSAVGSLASTGSGGSGDDFKQLRAAVAAIEGGNTQVAILNSLMSEASHFAERIALFISRGDTFSCWAATGFTKAGGTTDEQVKSASIPTRLNTVLKHSAESQADYLGGSSAHSDNDQLFSNLGGIDPVELSCIPIRNKGRVAAVFYADSGNSPEGIAAPDCLDVLVRVSGMAVELLPLRQRAAAAPSGGAQPAAAAAEPRATAAPAAAAPSAPTPAPVSPKPVPTLAAAATPVADAGAALSPEDKKLHDAAKRFARLLISEIKLYNEAKVVEGRKNGDLYARLKDDIDRSKQMFAQRVSPKIASTTNYFYDELVATLAEGDAAALSGYQN